MNYTVHSDSPFTAKCRKLSNYYRTNVLKVPAGSVQTRHRIETYGNLVTNGELKNLNFFNEYTFRFAKQKVNEKHINPMLTIDKFRLFNNLLSSMPMAFNLFGLLKRILEDNPETAASIGRQVFPQTYWLDKIQYIDIEFIPTPIEQYTNDKSAFDVFIKGCDKKGFSGIITIETKYTDLIGRNSSKHNKKKVELLRTLKLMENCEIDKYEKINRFGQLERNFLLTLSYKQNHNIKYFDHIILSPQEDIKSRKEIEILLTKLLKFKNHIHKYDLEQYISLAKNSCSQEYRELASKFYDRYLNFSLIK